MSSVTDKLSAVVDLEESCAFFDDDHHGLLYNCNDVFFWGCADAESVTDENVDSLVALIRKYGEGDGSMLWCCQLRGERPQGAMYSFIDKALWPLFDACGPERETGLGNPYKPGEYKSESGNETA